MYQGERFNSISHLVGAIMALAGLVVVVVMAARQGDPWKVVVSQTRPLLDIFIDRRNIYPPCTLVTLHGGWGWSIFGIIWVLAVLGILLEALPQGKNRVLSVIIYVSMGWLLMVALKPLLAGLLSAGFWWLPLGRCFYTGGLVFYFFDEKVRHLHGIWHLFVLAGSVCHYISSRASLKQRLK